MLRVRMGEWNAAGAAQPLPPQEFLVSRIFVHPNFNSANLKNDVAILRLAVSVPLGQTPTITTACLPVQSYVGQRYDSFPPCEFIHCNFQLLFFSFGVQLLGERLGEERFRHGNLSDDSEASGRSDTAIDHVPVGIVGDTTGTGVSIRRECVHMCRR